MCCHNWNTIRHFRRNYCWVDVGLRNFILTIGFMLCESYLLYVSLPWTCSHTVSQCFCLFVCWWENIRIRIILICNIVSSITFSLYDCWNYPFYILCILHCYLMCDVVIARKWVLQSNLWKIIWKYYSSNVTSINETYYRTIVYDDIVNVWYAIKRY